MINFVVVHPLLGIMFFAHYRDARAMVDEMEDFDLNDIGTLKSRSWLWHLKPEEEHWYGQL